MPSFEIADCPTRLTVTEATEVDQRVQKGTLTVTIRNKTERARIGRVSVETEGAAKPNWFSFDGALPTSPRELERDFAAKGSETVRLNLVVPVGEAPGDHLIRVRVTAEDDPDEDFTIGPNVAFALVPPKQAPPQRDKFPWWAIAVAAMLALIVLGGGLYMFLTPDGPKVPQIIGLPWDQAKLKLDAEKIEADNLIHVISPTILPPSRFSTRVVSIEPEECEIIRPNTKLMVYVGARNDPFFCRTCDNRQFEDLDPETRKRVQAGATLTATRYFGVGGPSWWSRWKKRIKSTVQGCPE
jgi:hypothetical protein